LATSTYKPYVSGDDTSNFTKKWHTAEYYDKEQPVRLGMRCRRIPGGLLESKAPDQTFHKLFLEASRKEIFQRRLPTTTGLYEVKRKKLTRALDMEWMFGNSALVHGLKYNPMINTFQAQLVFSVENGAGTLEEKEEIISVSDDWIKDTNYVGGVVKHVINLGLHSKFVEVPPGPMQSIPTQECHQTQSQVHLLYPRSSREKLSIPDQWCK
jgi:hypothetical protein